MSGSLAALVIIVALLVGGSTAPQSSTLSAATESKQLLSHADLLLTAAQNATTTERAKLVTEAKADLTHVARLLPLAPPQEQPAIRTQLQRLDRRVPPFAPARTQSGGGGANHPSNTGASGATTPVRHRPPRQQQSGPGSGADQTSGAPTRTGATSGTGTARQPAPTGSTGTQQTGNQPPPPSDGGMQPRQPQTQSGPSYGGTTRPPPGQ